jgi:hypothetical protein
MAWAELIVRKRAKLYLIAGRSLSHKWIFREGSPEETKIYDLHDDPDEHRPIKDRELVARGEELIEPYRKLIAKAAASSLSGASDESAPTEIDPQTIDKLRALGYLR